MTELVDTHCHVQSIGQAQGERITREMWAKVDRTVKQVLADARKHGVTRMLCVGCDLEDSRLAIEFVGRHEGCWASIGIHPHEAQHYHGADSSSKLAEFASLITEPKVVAIGECGLDFYYEHSPREAQIAALEFQLELAVAQNLPVIFHVREAFDDFWPIYDNYPDVRGVLHSFTDSAANLEAGLKRNLLIGINGIATFAKNPEQLAVYKTVPLASFVLETDAPFLTPTPYRGSINEPKRLGVVADFVAELRGENRAELAAATTANARRLFGI